MRAAVLTLWAASEAHLSRYLAEWDFKWNTRKVKDGERAALIAKGIEGKRLTYRPAKANSGAQPMKNFSPWQQLSIAFAILAILFYFALQIPWVAALFG